MAKRPVRTTTTLLTSKQRRGEIRRLVAYPWTSVDVKGFPSPLWVCYGEAAGRTVIVGLILSPTRNHEITARALRDLPMSRLQLLPAVSLTQGRLLRSQAAGSGPHPGPKGWPKEHYEQLAREYMRALKTSPNSPVLALYSRYGVSEATMHRWLTRCRELGLLDGGQQAKPKKPRIRVLSMAEWIKEVTST